jgi:hypothetical protein
MSSTLSYSGTLEVVTCWCGMRHAVPEELRQHQLRAHNDERGNVPSIYCPLGHSHVPAGKSKATQLEESLQWERERSARLAAARDQAEASARAYKGVATKARKRAAATKHPDYKPDAENALRHGEWVHRRVEHRRGHRALCLRCGR